MIYTQFCVLVSSTRFLRHDCIIRGIPLCIGYISKPFWAYIGIQTFIKDYINWRWNVIAIDYDERRNLSRRNEHNPSRSTPGSYFCLEKGQRNIQA